MHSLGGWLLDPSLIIRLLRRNQTDWQGQVSLFNDDMRSWQPPKLVDILISELLGSFGDNELSPECLDGAQRVLNRNSQVLALQLMCSCRRDFDTCFLHCSHFANCILATSY
jgi:hypothetical protein